MNVLGTIL